MLPAPEKMSDAELDKEIRRMAANGYKVVIAGPLFRVTLLFGPRNAEIAVGTRDTVRGCLEELVNVAEVRDAEYRKHLDREGVR